MKSYEELFKKSQDLLNEQDLSNEQDLLNEMDQLTKEIFRISHSLASLGERADQFGVPKEAVPHFMNAHDEMVKVQKIMGLRPQGM
jgi:hypothetical protein